MVSQLLILERRGKEKEDTDGVGRVANPLQPRLQVQPGPPRQQAGWTLLVLPPLLNQLPLVVEPRCTQRPEASGNHLILSKALVIENDTFPAISLKWKKKRDPLK